ncbi:hypothetical protein [Aquimarina rhabdastrellae]
MKRLSNLLMVLLLVFTISCETDKTELTLEEVNQERLTSQESPLTYSTYMEEGTQELVIKNFDAKQNSRLESLLIEKIKSTTNGKVLALTDFELTPFDAKNQEEQYLFFTVKIENDFDSTIGLKISKDLMVQDFNDIVFNSFGTIYKCIGNPCSRCRFIVYGGGPQGCACGAGTQCDFVTIDDPKE